MLREEKYLWNVLRDLHDIFELFFVFIVEQVLICATFSRIFMICLTIFSLRYLNQRNSWVWNKWEIRKKLFETKFFIDCINKLLSSPYKLIWWVPFRHYEKWSSSTWTEVAKKVTWKQKLIRNVKHHSLCY